MGGAPRAWEGRPLWPLWLAIVIAAAATYGPGLGRPLRDAEAKYAQVPREMVATGDWLTPHLNGARYYVKPPLTYWPTAALYRVAGPSEAGARLTNLLFGFLCAVLLARLGARLFDPATGALAAVGFGLTVEVFVYGLEAGVEFGLVATLLLAFLFFARWRASGRLADLCAFHASLGLAFLAKGLPGPATGLGTATLLLAVCDRRALRRLYHPAAVGCFLAVAGPWVAVMAVRHPEFLRVFFLEEHLYRFTGSMSSNDALFPTGLWLLLVAAELFPWVLHLPGSVLQLRRMRSAGLLERETALFLALWAAIPLALYAASRSKVDFYGLEIYPPLLLGVAAAGMHLLRGGPCASPRAWAAPWWGVAVVAALGFVVLFREADTPWVRDLGIPSLPVALMFLIAAAAAGLAAALLFTRERPALALLAVAWLALVLFHVQRVTYAADYEDHSVKFAADLFNQVARPGDLLVSDERPEFEYTAILAWYTGRTVRILRDREGSLMHFVEPDRDALCIDEPELRELAAAHTVFLVGAAAATPPRLEDLGLPWSLVGTGRTHALYRIGGAP